MARNLHSRWVAWLKVLLPLGALAILSSVVLFARSSGDLRTIPFVRAGGDAPAERVAAPRYEGMTQDGAALTLRADEVMPEGATLQAFGARGIEGRIEAKGGRIVEIAAPTGHLDFDAGRADLTGRVTVTTSDGFRVESDGLTARLDVTDAQSGGAVEGTAPLGRLTAGRMRYWAPDGGAAVMDFAGGVRLIYHPRTGRVTP